MRKLRKLAARTMLPLLLITALLPSSAAAEKLYTYRNEQGALVFSDKQLDYGRPVEVKQVRMPDHRGRFTLEKTGPDDNASLRGYNGYFGPVQVEIELEEESNIAATPELPGRFMLPALGERELVRLRPVDEGRVYSYRYRYSFVPGDPRAEHDPDVSYRLPIPPGKTFRISQGFNGETSHGGPQNRYAVDIAMPEGTSVHAAREGVVMEVANDFFTGGFDRGRFGRRANFIRILHDDGTMAVYAHLKLETARYPVGARVERGAYIADSGNTGYSSGPHLHFVVQKNIGMALRSVPFTFGGQAGRPFEPLKGMIVRVE